MKKLKRVLIFWYICLFPLGQLTRLPINWPGINAYLTDLVVGILGLLGILELLKVKRWPPLAKPSLIFLLTAGLSLLVNAPRLAVGELLVAGLYLVRIIAYFGLYLVAYQNRLQIDYRRLLKIAGIALAVFGLIQYVFWPDITFLEVFGWDRHYYRLVATFLDPNFTGLILVCTLLLLTKSNLFYLVLLALCLTYSRASYLSFWIGLGLLSRLGRLNNKLIIISLAIFAIFIAVPKRLGGEGVLLTRTSTMESRIGNWLNAWQIIRKYPILGVGFNAYRYAQQKEGLRVDNWQINHAGAGVDNSFLFAWVTTGIFGLMAMLRMLGKTISLTRRKSSVILATLVTVLVHSLFNNSLFYPWVMGWMALILASV